MSEDIYKINQTAYDQVAGQYAQANGDMNETMQAAANRLLQRLPDGARLLDLGCGAGRDLAWLQARRDRLFGADFSTGMLQEARKIVRVPLVQADMRCLCFASGSFGGLRCIAALLHLPHADAPIALAEMARVLAPGGQLHITVQKGQGEGLEVSRYDPPVERFYSSHEMEPFTALLQAAGFTILECGESPQRRHWLWFDAQKGE